MNRAASLHQTAPPGYSRTSRLRALGWVVALEAALLAALLSDPPDAFFVAIMGFAAMPALYVVIRLGDAGRERLKRLAESLSRPYPDPIPVFVLAALGPMYMVIAVLMTGRTLFTPELTLDRAVPLQPAWVLVYLSQWVFSFLPVFVVRGHELRRRAVFAYLTIVIVAYVGFLLYPTVGPRPAEVAGNGFFAWTLRELYGFDPPYNCFPSLHVAYSFLAALTSYRVHRGLGIASLLWAALVGVSTLYTKQHYIVDVIAGMLIAYAAYALFLRSFSRDSIAAADRRRAPMRALAVPLIYAIAVAGFWVAYQTR
jgi:membrane-associated phospholipid phosphatase